MSTQAKPYEELDIFNRDNFPSSSSSSGSLDYPVAQGVASLIYGVIWGDGSYQNSASGGGGAALTVQDGAVTVNNVTDINVTNGTLTDNGGGSVSITTGGGGGGGVQNPMTSDLDAGGFSIFNLPEINDCAAEQYYNLGPVLAGNDYVVGELDPDTDAEASVTIVSRCIDPGARQSTVFTATAVRQRGHVNCLVNLFEDSPVFEAILICDEGSSSVQIGMRCVANSNSWEIRVYMNQDDKGTGGPYGSYWRFREPTRILTPVNTFVEMRISQNSSTLSGNLEVVQNVNSATMTTGNINANSGTITVLTTGTVNAASGPAGISIQDFIQFPGQDNILNAGEVEVANISPSVALGTIGVGAVGNRTLYVDTNNRRVGINVANPQEDLEVDGNIQLDSNGTNKIKFYDGAAAVERAEIDATSSGAAGGKLVFYTKQDPGSITARMTIEEDGRIQVTNRIENMPDPVAAQDAATKAYVDAQVTTPGFVQNPMTSTLDGGQFEINNLRGLTVDNTASGGPDGFVVRLAGVGSQIEMNAASLMRFGGTTVLTDPLRISGTTDEVSIGRFNDGLTTTSCIEVRHTATQEGTTFNEQQTFNHNDPDSHATFPYTFFRDAITTSTTSLQQDGANLKFTPLSVAGHVEMPEIQLPPTALPATFRNIGVVRTDNITAEYPFVTVDGIVNGATKVVEVGGQCSGPLCGFQSIGGSGDYALPYSFGGTGWDDTDNGKTILMFPLECPFRNQGIGIGTLNYYVMSEYPPNSWFTGFSLYIMVGWIATGGATVDLIYGNPLGSFVVVEANVLIGAGFNIQRQFNKLDWLEVNFNSPLNMFYLKLNIPPGATIDAQEGQNQGCLQFIPYYKSLLVVD